MKSSSMLAAVVVIASESLMLFGVAGASAECSGDHANVTKVLQAQPDELSKTGELVVVVPESAAGSGAQVVVTGGPSQSVRVMAPAGVTGTAIGGGGEPGKPGSAGR